MIARLWMRRATRTRLGKVLSILGTSLGSALVIGLLLPPAYLSQRTPTSKGDGQAGKSSKSPAAAAAAQKNDEEYTKKIKEYTTEKFFLTEFVDHLPASETVPTPEKVLGYVIGTPNKLTYSKDIYRYFYELEKASPRVRVFNIGKTEEGRDMLLIAVSDEANIKSLDRLREITAKLADPRKLKDDAEADKLIAEAKPFYWASGSIHSPETGSPEMLMELGYRLAVEDTPFIQKIRKDMVVLITPTSEVDGRDREVDVYNYAKANPTKQAPGLLYWGKYVAHDNNRDGLSMALALSRNMMGAFLQWHPTILHDLHESVPFLYTSTGTGPYNAWLDPIVIDEWHLLAYHEIEEMTKRGVPGVWTHGFYDGWAPNYMFYIANGHNSIGRFYETYGGRGADTGVRNVGGQSARDWYRPNPPLPRVNWSIRNNINMQQSAILLAMNFVANNKERFLHNFYLKSKRSIEKANTEGPAAWVLPADDPRPVGAAELMRLLQTQGVEVSTANQDFEVTTHAQPARPTGAGGGGAAGGGGGRRGGGAPPEAAAPSGAKMKFGKGSYIIRMDQPYSRMADMLLDTQYFNVNDPRPYDDTGWTLGPLKNVKTVRVTDTDVLKVPMTMLTAPATVKGRLTGPATAQAFVINHNTDNTLMTLRYQLSDVKMNAAEAGFKIGDASYNAGSFIIKTEGAPANLRDRLSKAVEELGLTAVAVEEAPKVATHELAVPRIAILHTWTNTQNEGWFRIAFDSLKIPYSYISDHTIRDTENLRDKYDVIIFPPVGGSAQSIVRGLPMRGDPIPFQGSDITPNLAKAPDTTADMRGGMGLEGVMHLQKFIEGGGLFVTVGGNSAVPIDFGIAEGISIQDSRELQARGAIFNSNIADRRSPIAYGYGDSLAVYFSQAPLFQVSAGGGGFGGRGGGGGGGGGGQGAAGGGRPSGRGTLTDPDIPQGRPLDMGAPQGAPGGAATGPDDNPAARNAALPPNMRPRIIVRFAQERDLLVSGELAGGSELATRPGVVDVPVGKGHVVFFAINPMWRQETHGSFFLLFNAALNFDHLSAGVPQGRGPAADPVDNEDQDAQGHILH